MISRRLIIEIPFLLILGIIFQVCALAVIIVMWIPCMIRPEILNGTYKAVSRLGARFMARAIMGPMKERARTETETVKSLPFRYRPGGRVGASARPPGAKLCPGNHTGGTPCRNTTPFPK